MFDCQKILITGGTGSFGSNFAKFLLKNTQADKIIIFSRDEYKQHQLEQEIADVRLRLFLGDVRDLPRLQRALSGVDIVIHAAALKQVPALEYNPYEAIKTNVLGSQNVIEAALDQGVEKVLLISTDKAVQPINLYGSTKLSAEKLFVAGNSYGVKKTLFSVVRYGNVFGSRGSIIETLQKNNGGKVKLTDPEMTRFWITLDQSFELVNFALENMEGGEIFIPKIPSMKVIDLFEAIAPGAEKEIIGIRPGEKLHEILLTEDESRHAIELEKYLVILPEFHYFATGLYQKYHQTGKKLPSRFKFSSDSNPQWLTPEQLREMLRNNH